MTRPATRIHDGLVGGRELAGTPYLADAELRRQYQAHIAPRTEAALARLLADVFPPAPGTRSAAVRSGAGTVRRALDLGAGTGAVAAALRAHFGGGLEVLGVDRVPGPGVAVVADLASPHEVRPPGLAGRFDLIVAAHLLNELPLDVAARARRVLAWVEELLEHDGTVILIEPALRETSRDLLATRDRLVEAGLFVVAPCLWQGPCPALERERDWCHDAAPMPGQPRADFSPLVLRRAGAAPADPALFRIVSDPLPEKGRLRLFGCGPSGRHALVRLRKHRAEGNAVFDSLERGDLARIARTTFARDGLRLGPESTVERVEPRA